MSKFDPYIRTILNKIYVENFVEEITDNIHEILPLIINGKLNLFESDNINNELLSSLKAYDINLYKTLTFDTMINGIRNKTGFNKLTILSMFFEQNIQQFLNDIPADFMQSAIQLDQIAKGFGYDFRYFKCINMCVQKYESLIIDLCDDLNIQYRFFNYLFNRLNDTSDSGKISFLYLYSFIILYLGYSKITKYQSTIFYYITDNNRLKPTQIGTDFRNHYILNKNNIINTIENYCYKNIFKFNGTYTSLFDSKIDIKLDESLLQLVDIFNNNINEFTSGSNFLTKLISNCVDQHSYYSALYWVNNANPNISNDISFYEQLNKFFDVDIFATLELEEDRIYEDIKTNVIENIDILEHVEYVAWQFNTSPIYFLNSYAVLHYQYSSNIVDSMKVVFNIDNWNQKFEYTNNRNIEYRNYLISHPFVFNSSIIKRCSFYSFSDLISTFMDSEYVTNWIISDFFPALLNGVNENYYKNLDVYKFIDKIRWVIKLILIQDVFDNKLFAAYKNELNNYFRTMIDDDYDANLSDININTIFSNYPKAQISNILNGIYKSSFVNDYLNTLTSKYAI